MKEYQKGGVTNKRKERLGKRELGAYNKKMDYRKSTSDPNMKKISRNDKRLRNRQNKSIDAGVNVNYDSGSVSYKEGGPTRDIIRNKYGSVGTVDRTKKNGSSRTKEIEANTDGTGTVRKYKYDSKGMEKPGSYKTRNISARKAERKNKRIERKATNMYKKGGSINGMKMIKGSSLRRSKKHL